MNQKNTAVRVDPDLRYCGGEFTEGLAGGGAGAAIRTCTGSADVFSLGLTAYEMYVCIISLQMAANLFELFEFVFIDI